MFGIYVLYQSFEMELFSFFKFVPILILVLIVSLWFTVLTLDCSKDIEYQWLWSSKIVYLCSSRSSFSLDCVLLCGLSLKSILSGSWQQLWWVANSISDKCYLSIIAIEIFFALLLTHYGKQPMNSNKLQKNLQISMFCSCLVKYVLLQKINVPVRRTSNNKQIFFKKSLVLHDLRL